MLSVVHDLDVSRATATLKFRRIFAVYDVVCHGFLPLKSHTANWHFAFASRYGLPLLISALEIWH
ncbi:MAG: hypothetical protein WCI95_03210 [bacterium]